MRFLGSDVQFKNLKDSQENLIDSLLMNSFNEGFNACNTSITELYNQAVADYFVDPTLESIRKFTKKNH